MLRGVAGILSQQEKTSAQGAGGHLSTDMTAGKRSGRLSGAWTNLTTEESLQAAHEEHREATEWLFFIKTT